MGTKLRILSAAIRTFSERGYRATSFARISRDAGISRTLIHYHFATKDELYGACVLEVFSNAAQHVRTRLRSCPDDIESRMDAAFGGVIQWGLTFPAELVFFVRVTADAASSPTTDLPHLFSHRWIPAFEPLTSQIHDGWGDEGLAALSLIHIHLVGALAYSHTSHAHLVELFGGAGLKAYDNMHNDDMAKSATRSLLRCLEGIECRSSADSEDSPSSEDSGAEPGD